ncbi:hypothetical protein [Streptomyces sp. NPDC054975]
MSPVGPEFGQADEGVDAETLQGQGIQVAAVDEFDRLRGVKSQLALPNQAVVTTMPFEAHLSFTMPATGRTGLGGHIAR